MDVHRHQRNGLLAAPKLKPVTRPATLNRMESIENLEAALKEVLLHQNVKASSPFSFDNAALISLDSTTASSCNSSIFSRPSLSTTPSSRGSEISQSITKNLSNTSKTRRRSWLQRGRHEDLNKHTFKRLPPKVFECICDHIEAVRVGDGPASYLNDLYSLSLTSRNWERGVRDRLYKTLWIHAADLRPGTKRFLSKQKSRLSSVHRTLRDRSGLARLVQEIHVLGYPNDSIIGRDSPNKDACDILASLVSVCPKLEKVTGIYLPYCAEHAALSEALSRCPTLKEHIVVVGPNSSMLDGADEPVEEFPKKTRKFRRVAAPVFRPTWNMLHSLVIMRGENGFPEHYNSVFGKLHLLPSLENLHISDFSGLDFNDYHFNSLPPKLRSLRLENLPDITEEGFLAHFTKKLTLEQRGNLERLTMINLPFNCIASLAFLISSLYNLKSLTLMNTHLELREDTMVETMLHPFIISRSLEFIHWELDARFCDDAHYVLAESILANGLPSLKRLRAPNDPYGILQSVCQPLTRPVLGVVRTATQTSLNSPTSPNLISHIDAARPTGLSLARAEAYERASRALYPRRRQYVDNYAHVSFVADEQAYMRICVTDENGWVVEAADTPAFIGRVGPGVPEYWLESDVEGGNEGAVKREQFLGWQLTEEMARKKAWRGLELAKYV